MSNDESGNSDMANFSTTPAIDMSNYQTRFLPKLPAIAWVAIIVVAISAVFYYDATVAGGKSSDTVTVALSSKADTTYANNEDEEKKTLWDLVEDNINLILILIVGVIIIYRQGPVKDLANGNNAEAGITIYTVTLITIGGLILVAMNVEEDHVAPGFGLLGTIAGYLLGRSDKLHDGKQIKKEDDTKNEPTSLQQ